jgi:hypothetical protein
MKYKVKGIYEMTFFVEVDEIVEAETEADAMVEVEDQISAGQAYDQWCQWLNEEPDIEEIK